MMENEQILRWQIDFLTSKSKVSDVSKSGVFYINYVLRRKYLNACWYSNGIVPSHPSVYPSYPSCVVHSGSSPYPVSSSSSCPVHSKPQRIVKHCRSRRKAYPRRKTGKKKKKGKKENRISPSKSAMLIPTELLAETRPSKA
jgi:hypothetical protein